MDGGDVSLTITHCVFDSNGFESSDVNIVEYSDSAEAQVAGDDEARTFPEACLTAICLDPSTDQTTSNTCCETLGSSSPKVFSPNQFLRPSQALCDTGGPYTYDTFPFGDSRRGIIELNGQVACEPGQMLLESYWSSSEKSRGLDIFDHDGEEDRMVCTVGVNLWNKQQLVELTKNESL